MNRCCLRVVLFLGLLAPSSLPLTAAEMPPVQDPGAVPLAAPAVRQAMQDRNYPEARKVIDEAAKAKDAPSDYLAYLRGWSLHLEKQHDQAIAALEKFEKDFPQSSWLRRARFAKAQAMVAKGDFRGAQAIYEQEGKYLLSDARRQQSAAVYLEFADARFQPRRDDQKPDYKSARDFYLLALDNGLAAQQRPDAEFRVGLCLQKLGMQVEAAQAYERFLAAHADSPRQQEARYRMGECLLAAGRLPAARKAWQEMLKTLPPLATALESRPIAGATSANPNEKPAAKPAPVNDWLAEAAYHLAETWRCPKPGNEEELRRGVAALEEFTRRFPAHELAGAAHLRIAESQLHLTHQDAAIATLRQFLASPRWKESKELPQARWMLGQIYHGRKKYDEALAVWREYLARHTSHYGWNAVQQSIIDTEYFIGLEKYQQGDDESAARLLAAFMDRYPLDARNPGILFLFGQIHQRQKKWEAAIADWQRLAAKYPQSEEASRAHYRIARTLEEQLGRYDDACEQYRQVTGRDAPAAQAAAAAIATESMQVDTERVFRSGETPQLTLASRNVPAVKVRIYKIDLEAYFRKTHSVAGIQRLDVSLIDPDATLDFFVPEYVKQKPLNSLIGVPLPGALKAGVAAVTVACPTLETTTLLIQSDLEILVKSSRDEVLVFAQNAATGKSWPGVRLLISDGRTVFAETKTGEDGFFRQRFSQLKETAFLRVFAAAEGGHVASTALKLEGQSIPPDQADAIYIDTDRQNYLAGETVHARGCARMADAESAKDPRVNNRKNSELGWHAPEPERRAWYPRATTPFVDHASMVPAQGRATHVVNSDTYSLVGPKFVSGKKLTVELLGNNDRRLRRQDITSSAAGTFSCDFLLPPGMPAGTYKVLAHDQAGHHQSVSFQIRPAEGETLRLDLALPKSVYYRGETIEGTLRAVLPQERPMAGGKLRYKLGDGEEATATTDAQGAVHFAITTADLDSYGQMTFAANIPARSVSIRREVTVATQGFSVVLDATRSEFVAGETMDIRVMTADASRRPCQEKLLLKVSRQDKVGETTREVLLEEHPLATGTDGTAHQTLKLVKGGLHFLRATGTDRFGNTISDELKLTVSGDDDPRRLLLLVDHTYLKAGDTAESQVYWRGEPALAVVACHGDRLLQQWPMALQTGTNRLQFPVTAAMAPAFMLDVSVMADGALHAPRDAHGHTRLHEAASPLWVKANLQVKIDCHRHGDATASPRPGEPVDVTVTTLDAQGKPVSADVGLAVLGADRGDRAPLSDSFVAFFRNRDRGAQFQAASSIQFHDRPSNRVINPPIAAAGTTTPPHISAQRGIPDAVAAKDSQINNCLAFKVSGTGYPRAGGVPLPSAHGVCRIRSCDSYSFADPNDEPTADFAELQALIQKTAGKKPSNDDPFGDGPKPAAGGAASDNPFGGEDTPLQPAARAVRRRVNTPAEGQSAVAPPPHPDWPGYWNPAITTGLDGRATITLTPPDDVSRLTLAAKAVTPGALAGQASHDLVLKKDLAVKILLPPAFTDGDVVDLPVVIQNQILDHGTLEVAIAANIDGTPWNEKKTIEVKSRGRLETAFKATIRQAQRPSKENGSLASQPQAEFTVTVTATNAVDTCHRSAPILPYGSPCVVTATGLASGDSSLAIGPSRPHWATPTLQIAVSPSIERSLLDLLAPAGDSRATSRNGTESVPYSADPVVGTESVPYSDDPVVGTEGLPAASDLMAAVALAKLYPADSPEHRMLDERIRTTLCLLLATEHDGTWSANGQDCTVATIALAHWSLVLAEKAGCDVPHELLDSLLGRLRASAGSERQSSLETKAIVLHALAIRGQGDFALANHLLRDRELLSPLGRAYLALALANMDRKETAADVLKPVENAKNNLPPKDPDVEAQAVTAAALFSIDPASPRAKSLVESLLRRRARHRWNPEKATGPAVLAITEWLAKDRAPTVPCQVALSVNGKPLTTLTLDPRGPTQTVQVPLAMLVRGQQRIAMHTDAPARIVYRCTLGGVDPAESVQGNSTAWSILRDYEPGPLEIDERPVQRGFSVLSGEAFRGEFSNRMTQLPAARRGTVTLKIDSRIPYPFEKKAGGEDEAPDGHPALFVIEPLPSGACVVPSSVDGCFDHAEIQAGRIVFFISRANSGGSIRYDLEGVFPGSSFIGPTILRHVGRDVPLAVSKPKSLVILPQSARSTDPYRLSPDELINLAAIARRKGDIDAATRHYTELLDTWHGQPGFGLSDGAYKQTIFALMEMGMGRAAPAKLVRYCEIIKEKWPEAPVTLDQLLNAGGAYRQIRELERSYMACRAAVEGNFTRESGVAGFLEKQDEFLRSIGHMDRILRDYPPEPYVAEAEMELAQRVYAKAGEAPSAPPPQRAKLGRETLIGRAWQRFEAFLTGFPADPAADQAAFAAANAQLDLKRYSDAAQAVAAYARRYPQSDLLDSFWYISAYCDFAAGQYNSAIDMCRKVAQAQHLDKRSGLLVDSTNKYRAIYILGQIYQSIGQRADSIREYNRVADRIPDAKSSAAYFVRKQITLPGCTTLKPGTPAEVELSFRNIAACDLKVYRVDLMKFCEAAQVLGDLSQVNLSGIRPLHEASLPLADGTDYADHTQKLPLPLKKEGAYLVVCRGEDLYASGLLLISPLEIQSHFDAATGQVRVFVKDTTTGRYLSDVQVKLMPRPFPVPANVTGTTDFRGVFVGNCPAAAATIVAYAGSGRYAYFASPATGEARGVIAATATPEEDPTRPFRSPEAKSLEEQLRERLARHEAFEETGQGAAAPPVRRPRSAAPPSPMPSVAAVERPLPPLGPNSPTQLSGGDELAERKIREELRSPTKMEFVEAPLKDVVDYLRDYHHIEIQLDSAALKEAGNVDESTLVTKNLTGISLRSALKTILDELQLKYVIHNGALMITSPTKAESDEYMITKAYPVQDLVAVDNEGVDFKPLQDLLTNTVSPKSWTDGGGNGTQSEIIVGNRALLVISQTQEIQEEVEDTLEMMRKAAGLKSGEQAVAGHEGEGNGQAAAARPAPRLRPRSAQGMNAGGMGGMGGVMGGMGGGMGGMGMDGMPNGQKPFVMTVVPVVGPQGSANGDADLLGGVRSSNAANQNAKTQHLKQRQDAGQGGGMGGMGGGFF